MLLVIVIDNETATIDISENDDLEVLKQIIQIQCQVDTEEQLLFYNDRLLEPMQFATLSSYGLQEGDIIIVQRGERPQSRSLSLSDIPNNVTPEALIEMMRSNPHLMRQLEGTDSEMASLIATGDVVKVRTLMMSRYMKGHKAVFEREQELSRIAADPDSEESQRKMLEEIERGNIQENMNMAMENLPEAFARVCMLYINVEVNDTPIQAFVDSGAQMTIMSKSCAERCNLLRLLDTRYVGEARGVGTQKICGRIHIAQIKIGTTFLAVSITVLEHSDVEFLFGLDMLKRHRCAIDLATNTLRIDGSGGPENIPFLDESQLVLKDDSNMKTDS